VLCTLADKMSALPGPAPHNQAAKPLVSILTLPNRPRPSRLRRLASGFRGDRVVFPFRESLQSHLLNCRDLSLTQTIQVETPGLAPKPAWITRLPL